MEVSRESKRLLPWPEVRRRVPYTRQHLSRLEKLGRFPRRVHVGPNRVAWLESEIDEHIASLAADREAA